MGNERQILYNPGPTYVEYNDYKALEAKLREARGLLRIAACPNEDCVDGGYYGTNGEPCQCQWCAERDAILGDNDA